jgi:hypothetical protein
MRAVALIICILLGYLFSTYTGPSVAANSFTINQVELDDSTTAATSGKLLQVSTTSCELH